MEKKKSLVKASMKMPDKKVLSTKNLSDITESVERIHSKENVRLSLDVPPDLYKDLKSHHFKKGFRTTRAYLLSLIEKDLNP